MCTATHRCAYRLDTPGTAAERLPDETGHQYALRTVPGYALDAEGHSDDCVWRHPDHEECEVGDACLRNADLVHECGSVEHIT